MNVSVMGSGYVGLTTTACLAEFGHQVVCYDKNPRLIGNLNSGKVRIYESGLREIITKRRNDGLIRFSSDQRDVTNGNPFGAQPDLIVIAVGTPAGPRGTLDLSQVYDAATMIAKHLEGRMIVAIKSTVLPGTAAAIEGFMNRTSGSGTAGVANVSSWPEFMRQGSAMDDFFNPDRVIVGTECEEARQCFRTLLHTEIEFTSRETAELVKLTSNAFLATKISFINEVAEVCERVGVDVVDVARLMGMDRRIGIGALWPGPGYGGSCLPKDLEAYTGARIGDDAPRSVASAALRSNVERPRLMVEKIERACGGSVRGRIIGGLGVTYKAGTDDVRNSMALRILEELERRGALLRVYDPQGMDNARATERLKECTWCRSHLEAVRDADAALILTEWDDFEGIDMQELRSTMSNPLIVDLRNVFQPAQVARNGFRYVSVGRPDAGPSDTEWARRETALANPDKPNTTDGERDG